MYCYVINFVVTQYRSIYDFLRALFSDTAICYVYIERVTDQ